MIYILTSILVSIILIGIIYLCYINTSEKLIAKTLESITDKEIILDYDYLTSVDVILQLKDLYLYMRDGDLKASQFPKSICIDTLEEIVIEVSKLTPKPVKLI